jgi:hypothetical protein
MSSSLGVLPYAAMRPSERLCRSGGACDPRFEREKVSSRDLHLTYTRPVNARRPKALQAQRVSRNFYSVVSSRSSDANLGVLSQARRHRFRKAEGAGEGLFPLRDLRVRFRELPAARDPEDAFSFLRAGGAIPSPPSWPSSSWLPAARCFVVKAPLAPRSRPSLANAR